VSVRARSNEASFGRPAPPLDSLGPTAAVGCQGGRGTWLCLADSDRGGDVVAVKQVRVSDL
jgi:hypothetical protein